MLDISPKSAFLLFYFAVAVVYFEDKGKRSERRHFHSQAGSLMTHFPCSSRVTSSLWQSRQHRQHDTVTDMKPRRSKRTDTLFVDEKIWLEHFTCNELSLRMHVCLLYSLPRTSEHCSSSFRTLCLLIPSPHARLGELYTIILHHPCGIACRFRSDTHPLQILVIELSTSLAPSKR